MSRKNRSPVLDYLVYIAIRCFVCVVQMLDWNQARGFARFLAWVIYKVDKRHRLVALDNLRQAYPGQYSEAELDQLVRSVYRHFLLMVVEIVLLPRKLHVNNYKRHVALHNQAPMVQALLSERPVLIVTGHYGNWELAGYFLGLVGFTTYAIARPLDNPYVDQFLRQFREHTGQRILAKKGDFDQMTKVLTTGGAMATLGDQDAGKRGQFVEFFGRPASTHKAIALMALENDVPIIVSGSPRVGEPLRYRIDVDELILPEEYRDRPDAVSAMTQRFTTALEQIVRQHPEQYLWLHRRWKHQPPPKKSKKAAA